MQGTPATVNSTVSTSPALPDGIVAGRTMDGADSAVGKGLGVEAGRSLGVLVVPDANRILCHYWTHALAYVGAEDWRFFMPAMERYRTTPHPNFAGVDPADYAAMLKRIRRDGPLTIRDIDDDVLVEKTHPWASRKPSRRVLRLGFFAGDLVVSQAPRHGEDL
jgi:hypothetical protein